MIELAGAAALMGLVGSLHCVGMCGPFAIACGGRSTRVASWQVGKLSAYMTLGVLAGTFGATLPGPGWVVQVIAAVLVLWFGASAIGLIPEPAVAIPWISPLAARTVGASGLVPRMAFGFLNGLLPCGLVYAALGLAIAAGTATGGAAVMAAFAVGTAPLVTVFAMSAGTLVQGRPRVRRVLAVVASLAGLWVVARRGGTIPPIY